jgi:hypothetical protein
MTNLPVHSLINLSVVHMNKFAISITRKSFNQELGDEVLFFLERHK